MTWKIGRFIALAIYLFGIWLYSDGSAWGLWFMISAPVIAVAYIAYADFADEDIGESLGFFSLALIAIGVCGAVGLTSAHYFVVYAESFGVLWGLAYGVLSFFTSIVLLALGVLVAFAVGLALAWGFQRHLREGAPHTPEVYAGFHPG